jgi:hypothetical protein
MKLAKELTTNPPKTESKQSDKFICDGGFTRVFEMLLSRFMIGPKRRRNPNMKLVVEITTSEPKNINALLSDSISNYYLE